MSPELREAVTQKYPEIDTKNQVLNQEFTIDGYHVAIFYTKKDSAHDRYITAILTDLEVNELVFIDPIPMVNVYELGIDEEDIVPDSEIDIEDTNNAFKEIEYTMRTRERMKRSVQTHI